MHYIKSSCQIVSNCAHTRFFPILVVKFVETVGSWYGSRNAYEYDKYDKYDNDKYDKFQRLEGWGLITTIGKNKYNSSIIQTKSV